MLATPAAPTLETPRLTLRGWRADDFSAYAELLADADTARFITRQGRPYRPAQAWSEMAFFIGHWQMLGHGMFVVEERGTGCFLGRAGALSPQGWPGFEVGWALAPSARGKGYATEAAAVAIDWAFDSFGLERIISIIDPRNTASQRVSQRLGERRTAEHFTPFHDECDVWEVSMAEWRRREKPAYEIRPAVSDHLQS